MSCNYLTKLQEKQNKKRILRETERIRWTDRRKRKGHHSVLKSWVPAPGLLALEEGWWGEELRTLVQRLLSQSGKHQWHKAPLRHPFMPARFAGVPSQGLKQVWFSRDCRTTAWFHLEGTSGPHLILPAAQSKASCQLLCHCMQGGRRVAHMLQRSTRRGVGVLWAQVPALPCDLHRQVSAELSFPYLESKDYRYS